MSPDELQLMTVRQEVFSYFANLRSTMRNKMFELIDAEDAVLSSETYYFPDHHPGIYAAIQALPHYGDLEKYIPFPKTK